MTCHSFGKRRHCEHFCSTCHNGPFLSCWYITKCAGKQGRCKWEQLPHKTRLARWHKAAELAKKNVAGKKRGLKPNVMHKLFFARNGLDRVARLRGRVFVGHGGRWVE